MVVLIPDPIVCTLQNPSQISMCHMVSPGDLIKNVDSDWVNLEWGPTVHF